ncbi:MAG: hypothetical protein KHX14_05575 [[Clostridium] spiroforme]|uniref:DNA polymerase III subunit delta n=1 Tax=Thomasclavelia spiroformis TaxID=29348 RepID=A0A943EKL9_9FIRM|nr:hypothetical protein [Thomasclavelia spiroformis]MBS5588274.1 hypothetical protein [Thomasclavelia spiroformis]
MREYLKEHQPLFYNLIYNEFLQNKIPHAFLLVGSNTEKPLNFLAMSLICDQTLACMQCNDCRKVAQNKYGDIIRLNGRNNSIKKTDIQYIQNTFKKSSLEGKAKIYIIENIEYATPEAMNTLLKMLEEPTNGIYALFTTKNKNKILPTILSRCQIIEIKPDSKDDIVNQLMDLDMPREAAMIISYLSNDVEYAKNLYDERFEYMQVQVKNFIEDLYFKRNNLIINVQTNLLKHYKERNDVKLFLNILLLALKDMFHVKHNQKNIFESCYTLFKKIDISDEILIKQIEIILEAINIIDNNVNVALLMDSIMYKL